jgi:GTP-binding protein EngB required for normal cell division
MQPVTTSRDRPGSPDSRPTRIINALITPADEPRSIDELITAALEACGNLPASYSPYTRQIAELHSRLAHGRLHLAVIGEFNRGKSTFINGLIGMHLLPTSVLPITAVPTRIIYGPELSCRVAFFNGKPELLIRTSREMIQQTLLKYVAEENNPKNKYSVETVEVTVPSSLLENGTVLIDTPGFGSTHLHNTRTALESLSNCDAALFLLSADPPMTQTEVEFLKQVLRQVPRIFFILNKVDLLTPHQREQVDRFIGDILMTHLNQPSKPRLFHICARRAENARLQSPDDPNWASSGMEAVRNDVITFMIREKYFTLSQALNDKLKDALDAIIALLRREKGDIDSPLAQLSEERDALRTEQQAINRALEKEVGLCSAEKKAILKFLDEQLAVGKGALQSRIRESVGLLIDTSAADASALRSITASLNKIFPEQFATFRARCFARLSRPVKKTLLLHVREFESVQLSMKGAVADLDASTIARLTEKLEALEIDPDEPTTLPLESDPKSLSYALHWNDAFHGKAARIKRLHERYDHRLDELFQNHFFNFSKEMRQRIDTLFTGLEEILSAEYRQLAARFDRALERKESSIAGNAETAGGSTAAIAASIESFEQILAQLG